MPVINKLKAEFIVLENFHSRCLKMRLITSVSTILYIAAVAKAITLPYPDAKIDSNLDVRPLFPSVETQY